MIDGTIPFHSQIFLFPDKDVWDTVLLEPELGEKTND